MWVEGPQVRLFLNETLTVSYVEEEERIEQTGKIALQIHGNCKAEIAFRNLMLEVLPDPVVPPLRSSPVGLGRGNLASHILLLKESPLNRFKKVAWFGWDRKRCHGAGTWFF